MCTFPNLATHSSTTPSNTHRLDILLQTVRLWDVAASPGSETVRVWGHHTEFVVGLDWSVLREGVLASGGWDEQVAVWTLRDSGP